MNDIVVSSDKQFGRALFGLNKNEVYTYLNQINSAYEELQLQIQVLKEQNDKLSDSNRDNALKLYNLQNDITEAQRKTDRANVELEAAKKESAALRRELDAAEKRIQKLTDELIKSGSTVDIDTSKATTPHSSTETDTVKKEEPKKTFNPYDETVANSKEFQPKPIFDEKPKSQEPPKEEPKDIFAELRNMAAQEKNAAGASANTPDSEEADDEVYSGEVEVKVDESMLIGNDDDEDEGFNFL